VRTTLAIPLALLALLPVTACISASPNETGGALRFDTSPLVGDSGASCGSATADAGDGHAFSDLYRDYFGPTGAASCAGTGVCHGAASQPGAQASGYVCAPDANGCYQGMVSAQLIDPTHTSTPPEDTFLWGTIRKCTGGGAMPKQPASYMFSAASLARIHDWLAAGAPND
jgi:hypothetical protein